MKRCPKCGQMHEDSVLTCDCGQPLNLIRTEEAKYLKQSATSATPAQQHPSSRSASGTQNPGSTAYLPYGNNFTLTAIDIPFWSLMGFMFKFTFAALPAVFAATVVWGIVLGILSALFGGSLLAFLVR
jgi:hypothetical protein